VSDGGGLADRWRAARPPVAGLHLDSAACSRQSFAVLDAAAQHSLHEAEVGGYVAAEAAKPVLDAGRAAAATLTGMPDGEVVFTTGSLHALDLLLGSWPADGRTVACLPGEYGPNLALLAAHGFTVRTLATMDDGRLALDDAAYGREFQQRMMAYQFYPAHTRDGRNVTYVVTVPLRIGN